MIHPIVATLTLEEKAGLVSGETFWTTRAVERAGIPPALLTDGPHGLRVQASGVDHVGLNESLPATAFPTAAALGSSWDAALLGEIGDALGHEARANGVDVLLGPGVNIKRSPLCGRNFEYFSEDPLLAGVLGTAWVQGVQAHGVGASLKHFAANNQETERMRVSAEVDERTLREIYFPAFERVVSEAAPATVMCSYNRINGVYASQNRWLLTDVLRGDWGFDGYVVSDWGAVVDPVAALEAGLDLEMPSSGERSPVAIAAAVTEGTLSEAVLDAAVSRVISVHERLAAARVPTGSLDAARRAEHHALARRAAASSSVLLSNEGGLLPLDPTGTGRIAVVGEFARTPRYQGAGSSHVNPTRLDDALSAITAASERPVDFAPGFAFDGADDEALRAEAVAIAAGADVVVAFLGLPEAEESEGFDRTHIDLPEVQHRLLEDLLDLTERVVVVLSNGSVVALDRGLARVPALLEMWLGGQASGAAAADLLFGAAAPEGRLAETVPVRLEDTPAFTNWPGTRRAVVYGERVYVGYRWYDTVSLPVARPFGFGLTYTTFAYENAAVSAPHAGMARAIVEVTVTNTGAREGAEVVQVYVGDPGAAVDRPTRELRAFAKVHLAPGESRRVRLELEDRAFAYWDEDAADWAVDRGTYVIEVGSSSRDVRARLELSLDVPPREVPLRADATLAEWLGHPVGAGVLEGFLEDAGPAARMFADPGFRKVIGGMPVRGIVSFSGASDIDAVIDELLDAVAARTTTGV